MGGRTPAELDYLVNFQVLISDMPLTNMNLLFFKINLETDSNEQ